MPDSMIEVWLDAFDEAPVRVGQLRPSFQGGRNLASTSFRYDEEFVARPDGYAISPDLPLLAGWQYTPEDRTLPGALADAAPDEWGQKIIEANHATRVRDDPSLPRRIGAWDFLIGVSDATRSGALRLKRPAEGAPWLSSDTGVANVHDLNRILAAAGRYESNEATDDDIAYLGDVATSPGGARPKANVVTDSGRLALAKLPHSKDGAIDVEGWEALALTIAARCGIRTPSWTRQVAGTARSVLVLDRFDRTDDARGDAQRRLPYMSGATAMGLGTQDTTRITYEDFSDTIDQVSADPRTDLHEMFRRIALTVLVNNVDDHWRNHGFLRHSSGWRLAPMFDVNPNPRRGVITSRPISALDDPRDRDVRHLLAIAGAFRHDPTTAAAAIRDVAAEVSRWALVADEIGLSAAQIEMMKPAFSPERIERAMALG